MGRAARLAEFKPARRVFAGRGRSMLTFGEWKIALAGVLFGTLVGAGWFYEFPAAPGSLTPASFASGPLALAQPAAPALTEPVAATPATAPTPAAETAVEEPAGEEVLPQIVLAAEDGRRDKITPQADYQGRVARVVDGDTFYLEGLETRIRLWGVDAPERDEEGFNEATDMLALLAGEEALSCEHVEIDPYDRIVARCYFESGADLSEAMIDSGTATEYLRFTKGYYGGE